MASGGRVLCSERGCKFSTQLSSDALFEHCRTVHDWRDHPCTRDNCEYLAYSKTTLKQHLAQFHSKYRTHLADHFPCLKPNFKAAFSIRSNLMHHEKVHNNEVNKCVFCPYRNSYQPQLIKHRRMHFNTRNYKCEICQADFTTQNTLSLHQARMHEMSETTKCPLCNRVDNRYRIKTHLHDTHHVMGIKWSAQQKRYFVPEQIEDLK